MTGPCGCARDYGFLVSDLEELQVTGREVVPDYARALVDHLCGAAQDVEQSCAVDMGRVRDLVQPLSDEVEAMFRTVLDASTLEEPGLAEIALSGGELDLQPVKRGVRLTGAMLRSGQDVRSAANDAMRAAEGAVRDCATPECECAKASLTLDAVAKGVRRAAESTDVEDMSAAGTALRGVAEGVARACGLAPPPGAALDEVAQLLDRAARTAPAAKGRREAMRRAAREIAEAPVPEVKELFPSERRKGRMEPGPPPTRREEAQLLLREVERELRDSSAEDREARARLWLEFREMAARLGTRSPCPLPAATFGAGEGKAIGTAVGGAIGAAVPGLAIVTVPIGSAVGGMVGEKVQEAFHQEEPGFEDYVKAAGIPTFAEGERSVLDVRTDPEFFDRMTAEGFTIEQLASITVQQHRNLWWALGHGTLTKGALAALTPETAREFADAHPEPPVNYRESRERFRAWLAGQGLEQVKEKVPGPIVARPRAGPGRDPLVAEIQRGRAETRVRFRRIERPANPCPQEVEKFQNAEKSLFDQLDRLDVAALVRGAVDCERAAVGGGESAEVACKGPRDRLAAAHETLFPYEHGRRRAERDLMKCLGPAQARKAGLPHGRVLEEAPFAASVPPGEVRAYEEARDRLTDAVDVVSDYFLASLSACREQEERPSLMRVVGLA